MQIKGTISIDGKSSMGGAVLEPDKIVLYHANKSVVAGAAMGGLIGGVIGYVIAKQNAEKLKQARGVTDASADPELQSLDEQVRAQLKGVLIYKMIQKKQVVNIRETWNGYEFFSHDGGSYGIKAFGNKKRIKKFLQENGYNVPLS
ncbi:MAG: hypothetical protein ABIG66_01525 [Candidatus Kerfeldbacteria bacterium]